MTNFSSIPGSQHFQSITPVEKGWSQDRKYRIETKEGDRLLLRVSDISHYEKKLAEYEKMQQVYALGVPMSKPLAFGTFQDGEFVYLLLSWCDGEDAQAAIPLLPETEQYVLGLRSGEILKKIHSIPAPKNRADWFSHFSQKTRKKIDTYRKCGIRFPGDTHMLTYLTENEGLLYGRPQCYQHGDYHVGNMILSPENQLYIIDFNRQDYGDPWEEFNRIVWSAQASPHFATGQLAGYFGGNPPKDFFRLLAFYIFSNAVSSVYWAIPFGQEEVDSMLRQIQEILSWYGDMENPVPSWYIADFYFQYIDGIPCKLKHPFDFSFLSRYGKVFRIFDDQDSGNLCFGTAREGERYFVKFAGAPTARGISPPQETIDTLKKALPIYAELAHDTLIRLVKEEAVGGGYAAVFQWAEGLCMGRMYPLSSRVFQALPLTDKLNVFRDVLTFHIHVHRKGYVAIDFYDGSILYDPQSKKTTICDIDFYAKQPYRNNMGRLWGSSRYMSPEEFVKGSQINEATNVYTMGALAFALFADYDRSPDHWQLGQNLYEVVKKATAEDPRDRWQTIQAFFSSWEEQLAFIQGETI